MVPTDDGAKEERMDSAGLGGSDFGSGSGVVKEGGRVEMMCSISKPSGSWKTSSAGRSADMERREW